MIVASPEDNRKRVLAIYGNVQLEGPDDEVNFLLALVREAEAKQVRRSARLPDEEARRN